MLIDAGWDWRYTPAHSLKSRCAFLNAPSLPGIEAEPRKGKRRGGMLDQID